METIDYFLRRYREDIIKRRNSESEINAQLAEYERRLKEELGLQPLSAEAAGHGSCGSDLVSIDTGRSSLSAPQ